MSSESRMLAGILLAVLPSVMYGGLTLLTMLVGNTPGLFRQPSPRAGDSGPWLRLV